MGGSGNYYGVNFGGIDQHRRRQSSEVRGANFNLSTYPLSKTENSSDLVHYFWEWPQIQFLKNVLLWRANARTERSQSARSFTEGLPE